MTTTAPVAPITNGIRQPQLYICVLRQDLLQHDLHTQCDQLARDQA